MGAAVGTDGEPLEDEMKPHFHIACISRTYSSLMWGKDSKRFDSIDDLSLRSKNTRESRFRVCGGLYSSLAAMWIVVLVKKVVNYHFVLFWRLMP